MGRVGSLTSQQNDTGLGLLFATTMTSMKEDATTIRVFYRRGRRIELEQLDDVVAIPISDQPSDAPSAPPPLPESVTKEASKAPIIAQDANAFGRAGWMLVEAAPSDAPPDAGDTGEGGAPVFRDPQQDRLLIGTRRMTVKLNPGLSEAQSTQRLEEAGLRVLRQLKFSPNLFQAEANAGVDPLQVAASLQESDDVEYAEPEMIEHLPARMRPSDPQYLRQWQWNNDGSFGGKPNADVRAEAAWDSGRGSGVRVAVIDNGFDVEHPDLSAALDDATAHFARTSSGDAELKRELTRFPDGDHGTFCAGMVGARAENGSGGCGAAPESTLALIACLLDQVGSQATLARAVAYAADPSQEPAGVGLAGADIIACSLGPNNSPWAITSVLDDALTFAATQGRDGKGVAIFWAVDNAPNPVANDEVCSHPATVAVGRSTRSDRENGSAFGPELDLLAPGVDVFSTQSGGDYGTSTGTSFAAPCTAGVAALVVAAKPEATADEVRRILRDTCDQIGGVTYTDGRHAKYGFGRINAARAVDAALGVQADVLLDEAAVPAPTGPVALGPQLPTERGSGEFRWSAPSTQAVLLPDGSERELDVSLVDGRAVFEGDIVLTRGLETLGIGHSDVGRRWPGRTVVYDIAPSLPDHKRVTDAIAHWEEKTLIEFKKRQGERDYVLFRPGAGCSSAIGKTGGVQFVTLSATCQTGNVIHEIGHAVGLWHEQSREDRDTKVTIRWENIHEAAAHNFLQQIEDGDDINTYDYGSIMHYPTRAFSKNGQPTIVPTESGVQIGQREGLSEGDIGAVAKMYEHENG